MKTTIHTYQFNTRNPEEKAAWDALRKQLKTTHPNCMESHGGGLHYQSKLNGLVVTLETSSIFDNQWNTAPIPNVSDSGLRVFDWALDYNPGGSTTLKQGHYLDQTEEMAEVRRNIHKCDYCGAHEPAAKGYVFCPHCIGSEYLKAEELHLTRMVSAGNSFNAKRAPLTATESALLMPLYLDAQIHGNTKRDKARIAKERADIESKFAKETKNAKTERDGFIWLMDRGLRTDNVIFYDHTQKFSFGWRKPLDGELLTRTLEVLNDFPFDYEIAKDK